MIQPPKFYGKEGKALIANNQKRIQNDDVFVPNKIVSASEVCNLPTRRGYEKAIISNGVIVNMVGANYGHLPNLHFFGEMESKLAGAGIDVMVRSINRKDRSFSVEYILNDPSMHVNIKNGMDKLRPMLFLTNGYDSSTPTMGSFGFFRPMCENGLHVSTSTIGFKIRHTGNIVNVVIPEIESLLELFKSNEYYDIKKKFEVLAEKPITNLKEYVEMTCDELGIFQFSKSEKNKDASKNACLVMDCIRKEAATLNEDPSLWLGYNAFNKILRNNLTKSITAENNLDVKLLNYNYELALAN